MKDVGLISVVIPTYERPELTIRAIESALNQTYVNKEIIVVDDGSSESIRTLMNRFTADDIFWYEISHSGLPAIVRNYAISMARGKWIAFLDSDDYWYPKKLEIQAEFISNFGLEVISCEMDYSNKESDLQSKPLILDMLNIKDFIRSNPVFNSSVLVKRDIINKIGNVVENKNVYAVEDYATWLRVSTLVSWGHIKTSLGVYQVNSIDSLSALTSSNSFSHLYALVDYLGWLYGKGKRMILIRAIIRLSQTAFGVYAKKQRL